MKLYEKEVGKKFGRLTIVSFLERIVFPGGGVGYKYNCRCDCGNTFIAKIGELRSGHTQSCGCYKIDKLAARKTHGLKNHPLYTIWSGIKSRCYNPKSTSYYNYGKIGVKMCDEWFIFENFYDWCLANGWRKGLDIDRFPNPYGNYEPSNCRIATRKQNQNNRRNTFKTFHNGEVLSISEISSKTGIPYSTLYYRFKKPLRALN